MNKDFIELLQGLSDAETRFLVVGAYAVAVHGRPRATGDLDIWIEPTKQNASRVYKALQDFGAPLADLTEKDLSTPGVVFQMGFPPRRIDIITSVTGIDRFEAAWKNRTYAKFGERKYAVIGFDDLISNKKALARPKDLVDVEELERIRRS